MRLGGAAAKGSEVEHAAEERPCEGEVGGDDGGGRFANIPKGPLRSKWLAEAVVFVEDGGKDLSQNVKLDMFIAH